jgi:flagellar biosynthesis/type III secretory pathway protein FliH
MLDGTYELALLAELINHPGRHTCLASLGGVDSLLVGPAFEANTVTALGQLYGAAPSDLEALFRLLIGNDLDGEVEGEAAQNEVISRLAALVPNIGVLLAGYATLGDEDSVALATLVLTFIDGAVDGISLGLGIDPNAYTTLDGILSVSGDADGDGLTQGQELQLFGAPPTSALYISAALTPAGEGEYEGTCGGEGALEGEGEGEGIVEGVLEGEGEGIVEGTPEGIEEGIIEGTPEGVIEGVIEGTSEGIVEGVIEGIEEGIVEGTQEGVIEGVEEGIVEGNPEGIVEGVVEGVVEGIEEGIVEGTPEGLVEGVEEGVVEGTPEGIVEGISEGSIEGTPEGITEGVEEGVVEGVVEGVTEGEGQVVPPVHSADGDENMSINLSELLRVIQLFSLGNYACSSTSEDGYTIVGDDRTSCTYHSSDYDDDWRIILRELLRLIQLYNGGGYTACPEGEDGFCLVITK